MTNVMHLPTELTILVLRQDLEINGVISNGNLKHYNYTSTYAVSPNLALCYIVY